MLRVALWLALILTSLLTLPVLLIRAQPYDNHALLALLTPPPDCAAPCFMGIRPGITTETEALALLAAHPWVRLIEDRSSNNFVTIRWHWSGAQPGLINGDIPGVIRLSTDRRVSAVYMTTYAPLEQVLLTLGLPAWLNTAQYDSRLLTYYLGYTEARLLVWAEARRCAPVSAILSGDSSLVLMSQLVESPYAFTNAYIYNANLYHLKDAAACRR